MRIPFPHPSSRLALATLVALAPAVVHAEPGTYGVLRRDWFPTPPPPAASIVPAPVAGAVLFAPPALPRDQEAVRVSVPPPPAVPTSPAPAAGSVPAPVANAVLFAPPALPRDQEAVNAPAPPPAAVLPPPGPEELTRLKARARELLNTGEVASARAVLTTAAAGGDGEASFMLARTYDSAALARAGVLGVVSNQAKADALYGAARRAGYPTDQANAAQP